MNDWARKELWSMSSYAPMSFTSTVWRLQCLRPGSRSLSVKHFDYPRTCSYWADCDEHCSLGGFWKVWMIGIVLLVQGTVSVLTVIVSKFETSMRTKKASLKPFSSEEQLIIMTTDLEQVHRSPESFLTDWLIEDNCTSCPYHQSRVIVPVILLQHHSILNMCHHRRFTYTCGHFTWGSQVKSCPLERAFHDGEWPVSCGTMWSHPLHSRKLGHLCRTCDEKAQKTLTAHESLKLAMKDLSQTLEKHACHEKETTPEAELEPDEAAVWELSGIWWIGGKLAGPARLHL
jgi:hypothetical protein